jgi:hypothetical protein
MQGTRREPAALRGVTTAPLTANDVPIDLFTTPALRAFRDSPKLLL